MESDLPLMPSARTALTGLIDYAGLFPPSELGMAPALAEYASIRSGPYAWMVGRFVTAASRIPELRRAVGAVASPVLSVVVDVSRDPHRWFEEARAALAGLANLRAHRDPSARVEALEIPLPSLPSRRDTYDAAIGQLGAMLSQASCAICRSTPRFRAPTVGASWSPAPAWRRRVRASPLRYAAGV